MARRSCMSTWMVTRRDLPMRRIGMRSTLVALLPVLLRLFLLLRPLLLLHARDGPAGALQGEGEGIRQCRLGGDGAEVHAEVHDGLRDLRPDAADDAVGA